MSGNYHHPDPLVRKKFEQWVASTYRVEDGWWCRQLDDGGYSSEKVDLAWRGWLARELAGELTTKDEK